MFTKILIANLSEIACRVNKTAEKMRIKIVAVYSDAVKDACHVKLADEAVNIGPAPRRQRYLLNDEIIAPKTRTTGGKCLDILARKMRLLNDSRPMPSSTQSQYLGNATRNGAEVFVADVAYQPAQATFVHVTYLLGSGLGAHARRWHINEQGEVSRLGGAGQWDDDHCFSSAVDFIGRQNHAGACFSDLGAHHGVERDPINLTPLYSGVQLRLFAAASLARNAVWATANSRSNVSRSKSGSHWLTDSVNSALTHSSVSRANSKFSASRRFMCSQAATSSASSLSSSWRKRLTKKVFRCRGGTARANFAATSSGKRSSTCLGGVV